MKQTLQTGQRTTSTESSARSERLSVSEVKDSSAIDRTTCCWSFWSGSQTERPTGGGTFSLTWEESIAGQRDTWQNERKRKEERKTQLNFSLKWEMQENARPVKCTRLGKCATVRHWHPKRPNTRLIQFTAKFRFTACHMTQIERRHSGNGIWSTNFSIQCHCLSTLKFSLKPNSKWSWCVQKIPRHFDTSLKLYFFSN